MSPTRRRASRTKPLLIIGLSVFVIIAGLTAAYTQRRPAIDDTTLCPLGQPPAASTLVLVDTTDALNKIQAARLLAAIRDARDGMVTYGRLTILFLDASAPFQPRELVSLCNPGSPRDVNPLFSTESKVAKRWMDSFGAPIDKAVATLLSAPTSRRSPILEAITAATWRPDFDGRARARRLIVISDMLQNEPGGYSHYANPDLWRSFERSKLSSEADADLTGVEVEIDYIRRPSAAAAQGQAHRSFWRRWFQARGAANVAFLGVADGNPGRQPVVAGGQPR